MWLLFFTWFFFSCDFFFCSKHQQHFKMWFLIHWIIFFFFKVTAALAQLKIGSVFKFVPLFFLNDQIGILACIWYIKFWLRQLFSYWFSIMYIVEHNKIVLRVHWRFNYEFASTRHWICLINRFLLETFRVSASLVFLRHRQDMHNAR